MKEVYFFLLILLMTTSCLKSGYEKLLTRDFWPRYDHTSYWKAFGIRADDADWKVVKDSIYLALGSNSPEDAYWRSGSYFPL